MHDINTPLSRPTVLETLGSVLRAILKWKLTGVPPPLLRSHPSPTPSSLNLHGQKIGHPQPDYVYRSPYETPPYRTTLTGDEGPRKKSDGQSGSLDS